MLLRIISVSFSYIPDPDPRPLSGGIFSGSFCLPLTFVSGKNAFYNNVVADLWNDHDLSCYVMALQGIFSGSVLQYFRQNRSVFDNADEHGGLFLLSTELNPFLRFDEFDYELETLNELRIANPDNKNIQYLCDLRDNIPKIVLLDTDIYCLCHALFTILNKDDLFASVEDIPSYASISYWLINIHPSFSLASRISLELLWSKKLHYSADVVASIMYTCFCGAKDSYLSFVVENLQDILHYLKVVTKSLSLYIDGEKKRNTC